MTADKMWRTVASRPIVHDRWINLRADDCVTASGVSVAPFYVLSYPEWVHVVALTDADEVVLVRQYRHAAGAMVMELPGGMVDPADASPEVAGRRELLEETGFEVDAMLPVCALFTNPATHTNRLHGYASRGARRVRSPSLEAGEDSLTVHLVPVAELLPNLATGLLGQAMQVSALLLGLGALGRISLAATPLPPQQDPPRR